MRELRTVERLVNRLRGIFAEAILPACRVTVGGRSLEKERPGELEAHPGRFGSRHPNALNAHFPYHRRALNGSHAALKPRGGRQLPKAWVGGSGCGRCRPSAGSGRLGSVGLAGQPRKNQKGAQATTGVRTRRVRPLRPIETGHDPLGALRRHMALGGDTRKPRNTQASPEPCSSLGSA